MDHGALRSRSHRDPLSARSRHRRASRERRHDCSKSGRRKWFRKDAEVALFGLGNMFEMAEQAKDELEAMGYSVALINPRWIKPLDTAMLERYASRCAVLCTLEDHVLHNGFGCAVIEHLHDAGIRTPRSNGSAGRMNSSSMARSPNCGRSTDSPWRPASPRCCAICRRRQRRWLRVRVSGIPGPAFAGDGRTSWTGWHRRGGGPRRPRAGSASVCTSTARAPGSPG